MNPNLAVDVAIIRQRVRNGEIILVHIPGEFMPADGLTKAEKKAQLPLIEFFTNFRIGDRGVPMEVVDEAMEAMVVSALQAGRLYLDNFTEYSLAKFATKNYSSVLAHWEHYQESSLPLCSFIAQRQ